MQLHEDSMWIGQWNLDEKSKKRVKRRGVEALVTASSNDVIGPYFPNPARTVTVIIEDGEENVRFGIRAYIEGKLSRTVSIQICTMNDTGHQ